MADLQASERRNPTQSPHVDAVGHGGTAGYPTHDSGARTDTGWLPVAFGNPRGLVGVMPDSCRVLGYFVVGFVG